MKSSGKRFKLNDGLRKNLWLTGKPTCASLFPLLTSEYTSDVVLENLTLDGNGKNNANLNGNFRLGMTWYDATAKRWIHVVRAQLNLLRLGAEGTEQADSILANNSLAQEKEDKRNLGDTKLMNNEKTHRRLRFLNRHQEEKA